MTGHTLRGGDEASQRARVANVRDDTPLTGQQIGARVVAGMLVGQLLVVLVDRLIGGPGPFVVFGL